MSTTAKEIREDIARAKAFIQRDDLLRSLGALRSALKLLAGSKVFGVERFEIDALLDEALREVSGHKTLKKVLPSGLKHARGKTVQLYRTVDKLYVKLEQAMERARVERQRGRMSELDDLLITAQGKLEEKDEMEARKLFRRASERFRDVQGLNSDIGTRMMMGGLVQEAVEYLNKALDQNPRDQRAHSSLITCLEGLGAPAKAEEAMKTAIKYLGKHEPLMLRLAKLSLTQRNWNQAYDLAEAVFKENPLSSPAQKIMAQAKPKVYRPARAAGVEPGKPSAKPSAEPEGGDKDRDKTPIKLDF